METYDAVLLVSFGGPEGPDDVIPFLENVTRGRGIPRERLAEVGEHYSLFGGVSPINGQNRDLLAALRSEVDARGLRLPLYWGNRNWDPYLADALTAMTDDGVRRALCVVTSAYASYSGCRQYREDLAVALAETTRRRPGATLPRLDKTRHYFNTPGFIAPTVDAVVDALASLPVPGAPLAFVTHSIPTPMARTAGPGGDAYELQHRDVAALVAAAVGERTGTTPDWDLVYCSRSGPPDRPWLEPDVNDHLRGLAGRGAPGVVVAPIGFISDHMEVRFDLDTEAAQTAAELGLPYARAATVGTDPRFVRQLVDLVVERDLAEAGREVPRPALGGWGPSHDVCPVGCCPDLRGPRPAACGSD